MDNNFSAPKFYFKGIWEGLLVHLLNYQISTFTRKYESILLYIMIRRKKATNDNNELSKKGSYNNSIFNIMLW